jgi:hypothetical protein
MSMVPGTDISNIARLFVSTARKSDGKALDTLQHATQIASQCCILRIALNHLGV